MYKITKGGQISFPCSSLITSYSKVLTKWKHPIVSLLVLFVCAVIDITAFISLFLCFNSKDSTPLIVISVLGLFIGFDAIPVYLSLSLREKRAGYKVNTTLMYIGLVCMLVAFTLNFTLRIKAADLVLPGSEDIVTGVIAPNRMANSYSFMLAMVSVLTSFLSFYVGYSCYSPLTADYINHKSNADDMLNKISILNQTMHDLEEENDFQSRLILNNRNFYCMTLEELKAKTLYAAKHVRLNLSEHLGTPEAASALSADDVTQELEAKIDAYLITKKY